MNLNFLFFSKFFFILLKILPNCSSLYIFDNMIEPYLKETLPNIFLSKNETKIINLNKHYGGSQITFKFDAFNDPYIKVSFDQGVTFSSNKSISETPIEILLFPDQNGFSVSGAMLTDESKVYSIAMTDIYNDESALIFLGFLKLPDDLLCRKMTIIDSFSLILDCDSKINRNPQFLLVKFYMNNSIKNIDPNYYRINNNYNCPENESFYKNCLRSIKFHDNFLYRFCEKSFDSPCGSLEIFFIDLKNLTAILYNLISTVDKLPLSMQDLKIYDTQDIFILDYHFGLYEIQFTQNSSYVIETNCPAILGGNYYYLHFDCFDKDGIHDDFEQCKLIITSSHYITELIFAKNFECSCYLSSRKNLGESIKTIYSTYFSTNYVIVYHSKYNSSLYFMDVYDRNDLNTNILHQLNFSSESLVKLLTAKTDFYFSPNILNKLIVFTKNDHQLYLINIGLNIIKFFCCNQFPSEPFHSAHLNYSVYNFNNTMKIKDNIQLKIIEFNEVDLFSENSTFSINLSLSFTNFKVSLQSFLRGPNQNFLVDNLNKLNLKMQSLRSFTPPNLSNDLVFLKIIKINLNFFFFVQHSNYTIEVKECLVSQGTILTQSSSQSAMICFNITHEIQILSKIHDVLVKEDKIIIQNADFSLFSYFFDAKSIKFDGLFFVNNKPLNCPIFLFSLISSHCLCISYTNNNDFYVSIFDPTDGNDPNQTKIETYKYTNEYPLENFSYFDKTLLSNDIIFAKGPHCIHVLKLTYSEEDSKNSLKTFTVIDNEFTNVKNYFDGYHFNVIKSISNQKIKLIITNYETNSIAEFSLDDLISPVFSRKYPLFDFVLHNLKMITTINDEHFIVGCTKENSTDTFYLIYHVFSSTESNLIKIFQCDQFSKLYFVSERNYPLNHFSNEVLEIDFLIFNGFQTENQSGFKPENQSVFQEFLPAYLKGFLNLSNIEKSIEFNETNKTYSFKTTYNEHDPYVFNVTVFNNLSNAQKNIRFNISFDYSDTITSYSEYFLSNPNKNLTIVDLSEQNQSILPQYFNGPVISYTLENENPGSSGFELKTYIEFQNKWSIKEKIIKYKNNEKNYNKKYDLRDFSLNLMIIPTDDYLFVLDDFNVFMLNLSTIGIDERFDIIDIFALRDITNLTNLQRCNSFESDYNTFTNYLYLGCYNNINNFEEPSLYLIIYDKNGFDKRIGEIDISGIVKNVNSLKIMDNFIFIINKGTTTTDSLNDCSIFIFQIDLPIIPPFQENSNQKSYSFLIPLTNLYILNAQSFNVDYLFIYNFELSCLGLMNGSFIYGIILNDQFALYFCEISIDPTNKIENFYNKSVSDFVLKSKTLLNKLDLSKLLNLNYRDADGPPSITSYWINSNIFGEFFILISTAYELLEIKTSRFYFSDYYAVSNEFQEYSQCLNNQKINPRSAKNFKYLAFPCILNHNAPPYQTYLKIYFKNETIYQSNFSEIVPISQMLIFPASKFNDFFLISTYEISKLFVINDTDILEYELSKSLSLKRTMLNRTIIQNEDNFVTLSAMNNYSKADVRIHINNGFFIKNDWSSFYGLVIAPIIFCLCGMVVLYSVIKYSKSQRKNMLLKLRD